MRNLQSNQMLQISDIYVGVYKFHKYLFTDSPRLIDPILLRRCSQSTHSSSQSNRKIDQLCSMPLFNIQYHLTCPLAHAKKEVTKCKDNSCSHTGGKLYFEWTRCIEYFISFSLNFGNFILIWKQRL